MIHVAIGILLALSLSPALSSELPGALLQDSSKSAMNRKGLTELSSDNPTASNIPQGINNITDITGEVDYEEEDPVFASLNHILLGITDATASFIKRGFELIAWPFYLKSCIIVKTTLRAAYGNGFGRAWYRLLWTVAIIFFIPLVVIWSSVSFLVILLFPLPLTGVIWLAYAYCIKRFYAPKLKEAEAEVSFVQRKIQAEKIRDPNLTCLKIELDIMKKLEQQAYYAGFCVIYITVFFILFCSVEKGI